jgi:hypothetical protein
MGSSKLEHLGTRQQVVFLFGGWASFVAVLMVMAGHEPLVSGLAALMVAGQFTAGYVLWQALIGGMDGGFVGGIAFGAIFGSLLSTLSGIVFVSTPLSPIAWAAPLVVALPMISRLSPIARASSSVSLWLVAATLVGLSTEWTWLLPLAIAAVLVAAREWLPKLLVIPVAVGLGIGQWWLIDQRSSYWSQFRQGLTEVADYQFLEAVARGTAQWAHTDSVLLSGDRLFYHWISYAWAGRVSESVNAIDFAFSSHLIQVVFVATVVVLTYVAAIRLGARGPWPLVAAFSTSSLVGVPIGLFQTLSVHSPSQTFVTAILFAAILLVSHQANVRLGPLLVVFSVLAAGVVGGKVAALPALIVVGGVNALIAARKGVRSRAISLVGLTVLVAVGGFAYFFSGALNEDPSGTLQIKPFEVVYTEGPIASSEPLWLLAIGLLATITGILVCVPGLLAFRGVTRGESRHLAILFFSAAGASIGVGFLYVGERTGVPYFFNLGIALLVPVSAASMSRLRFELTKTRLFFVGIVSVLVGVAAPNLIDRVSGETDGESLFRSTLLVTPLLVGMGLAGMLRANRKPVVALVALVASMSSFVAWVPRYSVIHAVNGRSYVPTTNAISGSPGFVEAARWIRDNSNPDHIVATNRFCNQFDQSPLECDAYRTVIPAVSGRRVLIENLDWISIAPEELERRVKLVTDFVERPTDKSLAGLLTANVSWVLVDKTVTTRMGWEPWAEVKFENEDAVVLQLVHQGSEG